MREYLTPEREANSMFSSEEKITKFGRDVRRKLLEAGTLIGYLRWISQLKRLNLTFNDIKYSNFIDKETLQADEIKLIKEVKNKSQKFDLQDVELKQNTDKIKSSNHDPWQICCGHDLVKILSLGLCKAIGSNKTSDVEPEKMEICLRLAYEDSYFSQTQVYFSIRTWESKNLKFKVLRNDI